MNPSWKLSIVVLGLLAATPVIGQEKPNPKLAFLDSKTAGADFQMQGEYIGKVTKVGDNYFEIAETSKIVGAKQPPRISPQDGLCFYSKEVLCGCLVNKVDEVEAFRSGTFAKLQKIFLYKMDGITVGTEIYRNVDCEFEKRLKSSKTCRKISADIEFELGKIKIVDEDNNSVQIKYEFDEFAQNKDKMKENIANQLKKSGESDFAIENVEIKTDKIPFMPVSKINELRRELIEKLMAKRLENYSIKRHEGKSLECCPQSEIDYRGNVLGIIILN